MNQNNKKEINCEDCAGGYGRNNILTVAVDELLSDPFIFHYLGIKIITNSFNYCSNNY